MKKQNSGFTLRIRQLAETKGFTMIEILVVIGILGIIAVIGSNMFFTTLKASNKTKVLATVKQNGDYALSVMGRMIRDSQKVITNSETPNKICEIGMNKIKVKRLDGSEIEFSCDQEGTVNGNIASNSARLTSSEVKVDSCSFDCSTKGEFYPQSVVISFTLSQATVTTRVEEQALVNFKTTISVRNF
ncbi:MAG: type II secretion system protein [Candidatus Shapirobacteria bacterium]|nr:type II secretion system protein [Candidatus Shapirobacteria bacterium]